jgi:FHA domain
MAFLGIEFNDSLLTACRDKQLLFAEPGCAVVAAAAAAAVFGAEARRTAFSRPVTYHDRYWRDLSEQRLTRAAPPFESSADLAFGQLGKLWQACSADITQVGYAVPVYWSKEQLALLLGISAELGIPVTTLVEIPVAATRREYPDSELLHVDVSAHATTLSYMTQQGAVGIQRNEVFAELGKNAIERSCAEYFARRFLACSRFDPLHAADSEQIVYEQLGSWLDLLNRNAEVTLQFQFKSNEFQATVTRADLVQSLQRRMQPLIQALRASLRVDRPTALQLNAVLAGFPGLAELFTELPGCDVFTLEPGAAARGLAQRQAQLPHDATARSICRSLPWDQPPATLSVERAMASPVALQPSHVVCGSRAWRLGGLALRVGSEAVAGEYSLVIDARHAGISRQHCSIETSGGRIVLNDHSRFGTRLNGHKVQGSAVLQPGDVIMLGDPVCELTLVAETVAVDAGCADTQADNNPDHGA